MDREDAKEDIKQESDELKLAEPERANTPSGSVIVSVCTTCKTVDGGTVVGPEMFAAVRAAIGDFDRHVLVRPVQGLSVCKRPATVAVTSADCYTFKSGDLHVDTGAAAPAS